MLMATLTTPAAPRKAVRELPNLRTLADDQRVKLAWCHRCHRCHRCHHCRGARPGDGK